MKHLVVIQDIRKIKPVVLQSLDPGKSPMEVILRLR